MSRNLGAILAGVVACLAAAVAHAQPDATVGPPMPDWVNGVAVVPASRGAAGMTPIPGVTVPGVQPLSSGLPTALLGAAASGGGLFAGVGAREDRASEAREVPFASLNPISVISNAARAFPSGAGTAATPAAGDGERGGLSAAINILLLLTVIGLAPSIMLMTTCFMRMLIVLGFLRQAIGTQSIPPPQVVTALALFMTLLVMAPTIDRVQAEAIAPYQRGEIRDYDTLWLKAKQPLRDFMFAQIESTGNWSSLYMLMEYRGQDISAPERLTREDVDMVTLVPAYMLSELKVSFLMGFRVYLPFLVIDMVISTMLISMGMMMLPPVLISLPFKLLLFVLVDGWAMVVGGLMHSFASGTPGATVTLLPSINGMLHEAASGVGSIGRLAFNTVNMFVG